MPTVTLHFPHCDQTGVELPEVPYPGSTFHWCEKDGTSWSAWTVTSIDTSAGHPRFPVETALTLNPADAAAERLVKGTGPAALDAPVAERRAGQMTEEEAEALIGRRPSLAPLGSAWVRSLVNAGYSGFQLELLVKQLQSAHREHPDAASDL
ncbi:hypothetical protein ACWDZ4_20045 [Streptomyces sp. NPDC003016]